MVHECTFTHVCTPSQVVAMLDKLASQEAATASKQAQFTRKNSSIQQQQTQAHSRQNSTATASTSGKRFILNMIVR